MRVLVTCEHGGYSVPEAYRARFVGAEDVLCSHRGWDPGALALARRLADALGAPLRAATVSRLVVDLNRSPHHPQVFSEWTRPLPVAERRVLLAAHHTPYRAAVHADVDALAAGGRTVLHLSVHSFTPVLDGDVRTADVALLYDPAHPEERTLASEWARALAVAWPDLAVRRNQPYRGASDGLTTRLRRRHSTGYLGIELEVNQRLLERSGRFSNRIADGILALLDRSGA